MLGDGARACAHRDSQDHPVRHLTARSVKTDDGPRAATGSGRETRNGRFPRSRQHRRSASSAAGGEQGLPGFAVADGVIAPCAMASAVLRSKEQGLASKEPSLPSCQQRNRLAHKALGFGFFTLLYQFP